MPQLAAGASREGQPNDGAGGFGSQPNDDERDGGLPGTTESATAAPFVVTEMIKGTTLQSMTQLSNT